MKIEKYHFPIFSTKKPTREPNIRVIIEIGISETGSCQPIMDTFGNRIRKEIIIPFNIDGNFKLDVHIINPETTKSVNADKFASQVTS